jgi:DNA-directed RNA polymerase subunit omega
MFKPLKNDQIVLKVGGRFKLTALIQHRIRELMEGARPLVERHGRSDLEVALEEVDQGKLTIELAETEPKPKVAEA